MRSSSPLALRMHGRTTMCRCWSRPGATRPTVEVDTSSQTVRFVLDGEIVAIDRPPATMTVLEYLRDVACRRGTKEGCAEGDCGACTVVIGELSAGEPSAGESRVTYRAVNSCI